MYLCDFLPNPLIHCTRTVKLEGFSYLENLMASLASPDL